MPTFVIMGVLAFNTVTKRNSVLTIINNYLTNHPAVASRTTVATGTGLSGNPTITLNVAFAQKPNMQSLFDLAKTELNKLTGVTATFTKHTCFHGESNQPCQIEEKVTIIK